MSSYGNTIKFIKDLYRKEFIPLHEPLFIGNEKKYVADAIDSTYVSSVGEYVNQFEKMIASHTDCAFGVAVVNGTAALHTALILGGVSSSDEVITQALTFVATANAISYLGASPIFIDVEKSTLGLCPVKLQEFLETNSEIKDDGFCYNKGTGKRIKACVPMHTFGFPMRIDAIAEICRQHNIFLIEDAAESMGSYYKGKHTGSYGDIGIFSFNGNKTITCGGGGALVTNNANIARRAKHLTTQAKVPHKWNFFHDEVGYNYRMPNLNAALACAQLEQLKTFVHVKRAVAEKYRCFFEKEKGISWFNEPNESKANYWLNCILLENQTERDKFLAESNDAGVMTRPVWTLVNKLPIFNNCQAIDLQVSTDIENRLVNIPSSVIVN